jgi:hypothetical protein
MILPSFWAKSAQNPMKMPKIMAILGKIPEFQ